MILTYMSYEYIIMTTVAPHGSHIMFVKFSFFFSTIFVGDIV